MTAPNFNPGFRILPFDVLGLIIGLLGALSTILIWIETKRDNYHGILWKKLNPGMPEWWESYR